MVPYTWARMVQYTWSQIVLYTWAQTVPDTRAQMVPYTRTQMVPYTWAQSFPYTCHSETPMPKNDTLIFHANKRPPAGTIYITFPIYLKAIYGQKMKEIDFSTLATKSVFFSIFPDRRS